MSPCHPNAAMQIPILSGRTAPRLAARGSLSLGPQPTSPGFLKSPPIPHLEHDPPTWTDGAIHMVRLHATLWCLLHDTAPNSVRRTARPGADNGTATPLLTTSAAAADLLSALRGTRWLGSASRCRVCDIDAGRRLQCVEGFLPPSFLPACWRISTRLLLLDSTFDRLLYADRTTLQL